MRRLGSQTLGLNEELMCLVLQMTIISFPSFYILLILYKKQRRRISNIGNAHKPKQQRTELNDCIGFAVSLQRIWDQWSLIA
jgi:hypothetical protein